MTTESIPTETPVRPTRYGLLLPPGWARLSLTEGDDNIRRLLDNAFAHAGRDEASALRREVTKTLEDAVRQAREQYGIDMYLPVDGRNGVPVAASILVSHLPLHAAPSSQPTATGARAVVESLADSSTSAQLCVVADSPAARAEWTTRPTIGELFAAVPGQRCRHVTYVTPTPPGDGWLVVAFTTAEFEVVPELAASYVDLFDAMLTTLRWLP